MTKIILLVITVAFVNQVIAGERTVDITKALTENIGKHFESTLNKHKKSVEEEHIPLVETLKQKGCDIFTNIHALAKHSNARAEACVLLTQSIGALEADILQGYYVAESYVNISLIASQNVSICLQDKDIAFISICLLQEANYFGSKVQVLNENLRNLLIDETDLVTEIISQFNECFSSQVPTVNALKKEYIDRFCISKLNNDTK